MVRAAKLSGNGSGLFPEGVTSVNDIPWDLSVAIEQGLRICNWQENLLDDEMPPNWMWPFDDELEIWFENVDRERAEKYGGSSSSSDVESTEMMGNELARERFGR